MEFDQRPGYPPGGLPEWAPVVGSDAGRKDQHFFFSSGPIRSKPSWRSAGTSILTIFLSLNYQIQRVLYGAGVPVPVGVDTASESSYFKFNLDSINLYNLIRLKPARRKSSTSQRTACSARIQRRTRMRSLTSSTWP
jgi:hypothetical protein